MNIKESTTHKLQKMRVVSRQATFQEFAGINEMLSQSHTSHWLFPLKQAALCHLLFLGLHLVSCEHLWPLEYSLCHCKERTKNYEQSQSNKLNQINSVCLSSDMCFKKIILFSSFALFSVVLSYICIHSVSLFSNESEL